MENSQCRHDISDKAWLSKSQRYEVKNEKGLPSGNIIREREAGWRDPWSVSNASWIRWGIRCLHHTIQPERSGDGKWRNMCVRSHKIKKRCTRSDVLRAHPPDIGRRGFVVLKRSTISEPPYHRVSESMCRLMGTGFFKR